MYQLGKSANSPKGLDGKEMKNIDTIATASSSTALQPNPAAEYKDHDNASANKWQAVKAEWSPLDGPAPSSQATRRVRRVADTSSWSQLGNTLDTVSFGRTEESIPCLHGTKLRLALPSLVGVNTVGRLQEMAQAKKWKMPLYQERGTVNSLQCVKCTFQDITTEGWSTTKKEAKKKAAAEMLAQLNVSQSFGSTSPVGSPITSTTTSASEITHPTIVDVFNIPVSDHLIDLGITTDNEVSLNITTEEMRPHLVRASDTLSDIQNNTRCFIAQTGHTRSQKRGKGRGIHRTKGRVKTSALDVSRIAQQLLGDSRTSPKRSRKLATSGWELVYCGLGLDFLQGAGLARVSVFFIQATTMASNTVGELQEYCMQHRISTPSYRVTMESGPPHNRTFTITCQVGEHITKVAKLANALVMLSSTAEDGKIEVQISVGCVVKYLHFYKMGHKNKWKLIIVDHFKILTHQTGQKGMCQHHNFMKSIPQWSQVLIVVMPLSELAEQRPNAGTENMDLVEEDDYKSNLGSGNKIGMLQELCQRMKWEMPVYTENGILNQQQSIKCTLRDMTTVGFNISKKDAKKMAAGKMLALLNISDERFTSRPAKSNPTYTSEHPIPINEFVSNSDIKSPKTVEDSTSKTPPDLAKVIELFRSLKSPKAPTISSNPDVVEKMHLKFQSKEGVILNEIIEAFNYEEQDDIDYVLLLEKLSKEQHFTMQFDECESLDPSSVSKKKQFQEHTTQNLAQNIALVIIICLEFGGFERFLWDIVTVASSVSSGDLKDVIHVRNQVEDCCVTLTPVFQIFNTIAKLIYLQGAQVGVMKDCDVTKVVTERLAIFSPGEISQWVSLYTAGQVDYPSYKPIRSDGTAANSKKSVYKFIGSLPVGGFPLTDQTILGSGSPWASHFTVTFSFSFALCTTDVSMKKMGSGDKRSNDATPLYKHPHSPSFYNTYLPFLADTSVPPLLSHIIKFPLLEHVTNKESLTFLTVTGAEGCKTIASLVASTTPAT
uniref:DRBM domain-containing protein n=1 Tax=Timema shepardi TaxID=629360 RepID=A0A7R9ASC8_TIMSH|nr:unnamed protein product [Timema shepardi]